MGPPAERLDEGEIDLTGATRQDEDLADVIGDAIHEATQAESEVPDWGARAIARYLANRQGSFSSAVHQFAATGNADLRRVGDEIVALWNAPETTDRTREWINWLGTYVVRQINYAPPEDATPEIRAAVAEHGQAFLAFLRLPDVTQANAVDLFAGAYVGSYPSVRALVADLVDTLGVETLADIGAVDEGRIDPTVALRRAREVWDIVELGGRYYLFNK